MSDWIFNLKSIRENRGLTQKELALKSKCSLSTIQSCEISKRSMNFDTMTRIIDALNVNVNELITRSPAKLDKLDKLCKENGIRKEDLISNEEFYEKYQKDFIEGAA